MPTASDPVEPPIPSPCVRRCCLDDDDVCLGCGRSLKEIMGWSAAGAGERRQIVARARQRLNQGDSAAPVPDRSA